MMRPRASLLANSETNPADREMHADRRKQEPLDRAHELPELLKSGIDFDLAGDSCFAAVRAFWLGRLQAAGRLEVRAVLQILPAVVHGLREQRRRSGSWPRRSGLRAPGGD